MTKSELIAHVAAVSDCNKVTVSQVLDALFGDVIPDCLAEGTDVAIAGFGKFVPTMREARVGRNPSSGESIDIPAKMAVKFKPATDLKNKIN
jgi:DNA-binding protein HU-beta